MNMRSAFLAVALATVPAGAMAQGFTGAPVSEQYYFPDLTSPYLPTVYTPQTFVIGAGQESTIVLEGVTTFNIDFSDTALDIVFDTVLPSPQFAAASFNGLVFTSPAFSSIAGVSISATSNLAGFDASRVSVVGNDLRLDWSGLSYDTDTVVGLSFAVAPGAVPEPASWAMMIVGFGVVGAGLRRRRTSTLCAA